MSIEIKRRYWRNGKLKYETTYQNGKYHGTAKYWNENGNLMYEDSYQDGVCHGVVRGWNKDGKLSYILYYLYGNEVIKEEWRKHELIEKLSCLSK